MFMHNISNYRTNLNDREYLCAQMRYDKTNIRDDFNILA